MSGLKPGLCRTGTLSPRKFNIVPTPRNQEIEVRMANLFAKKSMDVLMAEASATGVGTLKRSLGPFELTTLGIGAVIGAGIFVWRAWARTTPGRG